MGVLLFWYGPTYLTTHSEEPRRAPKNNHSRRMAAGLPWAFRVVISNRVTGTTVARGEALGNSDLSGSPEYPVHNPWLKKLTVYAK